MIVTEYFITREDGVVLNRTYSDANKMIRQDGTGVLYDTAIDPVEMNRTYTETDIDAGEDISAEEALSILLGGTDEEN